LGKDRFRLLLVPAVSAAMLAFGCEDTRQAPHGEGSSRICVDPTSQRVGDDRCLDTSSRRFYHWYYMSGGGFAPAVGGFVHATPGGSSEGGAGHVGRGGFGSSAHGSGGGE